MCHACSFPTTLGAWHPDPLIRPLSISWMLRSSITSSSSDSPLCTSITPSLFHSRLKTYLFHKSYPLPRSFTSGMPPRTFACTVSSELLAFWFYFLPLFFPFWAVRLIKLAIPSAFERTLIYRIVSYRKYTLRPIATDVIRNMRSVCLCVCVSVCLCVVELCKKTEAVDSMVPRNHVLNDGQDPTKKWGVTSRRCVLLPNYFGHLLLLILSAI